MTTQSNCGATATWGRGPVPGKHESSYFSIIDRQLNKFNYLIVIVSDQIER